MESGQGRASLEADSRLALRTTVGAITLVLLCAVQFLDIADSAIVNVALPSIQHSLNFSQQNLQWVASGYILTYGGFLLLGGRLADLLGRRRMLLAGLAVFAVSSMAAGLAGAPGLLVGARLVQGLGAALMAPAALSELTTSFREGKDRNTALGAWGAISGMAAAAGVFLGGVISQGPGWRWVFFVNPPICVAVAAGALVLLAAGRRAGTGGAAFDSQGAALVTGGMLLLVYGLVRAPAVGWGSSQTVITMAGSALLIAAFTVNERRSRNPLVPFQILRVRGLVAADLTQLIAFCGFFSMFFYATLYMQEVLHYSPVKAGVAYLPVTAGFAVAGGIASQLISRVGTRPVVVAGCLVAAAGIYYVSRVPLHGTYPTALLPGFLVMSLGAGSVFVAITAAANAGVPAGKAGLAAGLLNSSQQIGSALGLAILSAVAISRTSHMIAANASPLVAADAGYHRALVVGSIVMAAGAVLALRIGNTRRPGPLVLVSSEPRAEAEPAAAHARERYPDREMTDSAQGHTTGRRPGKRERLVAAAVQLLHQQGIERTTLADIATAADVPVGNVYYYFKTKDEVIAAVLDAHAQQITATLAAIDARHRSPKGRLKALVREFASVSDLVAQYGCPFGSLCSEIDKRGAESGFAVGSLMRLIIEWAETQFRALGRRDAHDLAIDLLAAYEGSALLANTMRDPAVLAGSARRLGRWIESL